MIPYGWHVWRGESSVRYRFKITKTVEALPDAGGIYVMVKRTCFFFLSPVYIGKASNLQGRHSKHERWEEAAARGASERHYLCIRSENKRQQIEEDLIRRYKPRLNGMLVPKDGSDAPNHEKLRSGWMSAKDYWGLPDKPKSEAKESSSKARPDSGKKSSSRKSPSKYWGRDSKAA